MAEEKPVASDVKDDSATAAATENAEVEAKKPEAEAEGKEAKSEEGDAKPDAAKEAEDAKKASEAGKELQSRKKTAAERIGELTFQKREAERKAAAAEKEAGELRAKLKELKPEDFDDPAELTAAKVDQTMERREAERLDRRAKESNEEAQSIRLEVFSQRADEAREKYDDFDKVVMAEATPLSKETQSLVLEMDESAEVAYHLCKNPNEARRINRLPDRDKAFELGKIAARISEPPPRKTTQAPQPIEKQATGSGSGGPGFDPVKASAAEYSERYRKMKERERGAS